MTSHHAMFIHSGHPLETLVADMAPACGGRLQSVPHRPADYSASLGDAALELEPGHGYAADKGIPFDRYQVVMTVRDLGGDKERERATAGRIFRELAALRRYWLVLVFDLQVVIDTAAPPGQELFPPARGR